MKPMEPLNVNRSHFDSPRFASKARLSNTGSQAATTGSLQANINTLSHWTLSDGRSKIWNNEVVAKVLKEVPAKATLRTSCHNPGPGSTRRIPKNYAAKETSRCISRDNMKLQRTIPERLTPIGPGCGANNTVATLKHSTLSRRTASSAGYLLPRHGRFLTSTYANLQKGRIIHFIGEALPLPTLPQDPFKASTPWQSLCQGPGLPGRRGREVPEHKLGCC